MKDPLVVSGSEPGAELPRHPHRPVLGQAADPSQQRRQVLSVDVLHRQEVLAVHLPHVPHVAHVRVCHLAGEADLVEEPPPTIRVFAERGGEKLEGDRLPELRVVGPVDLAHSPPAEARHDPIAAGQDLPGQEPGRGIAPRPCLRGARLRGQARVGHGARASHGPGRRGTPLCGLERARPSRVGLGPGHKLVDNTN
jgi:hypothetical protein